jgi:N-methylhydantoinase A
MTTVAIGIDVGGTFTDVVAVHDDGTLHTYKVLNAGGDRADGAVRGTLEASDDLAGLRTLVHGTTVATNAILERKGATTSLVTTRGFRDVLELQHQDRSDIWDLFYRKPEPLVPRHRRFEVDERLAADGSVIAAVAETGDGSPAAIATQLRALGTEAVAIVLLHGYRNDAHEREVEARLSADLPGVHISRSSLIVPQFREYDRSSTTVINAYVAPLLAGYLANLSGRLADEGFRGEILVMQSNGGVVPVGSAAKIAATTCLSGPAGGVLAAATLASDAGVPDFLCLDMGGTSTDVALVRDGRLEVTTDGRIGGLPNLMPTLRIETVGAGGGSIARVDEGGMLQVGPESAGAEPGPACYGRGGVSPTVTDAWCIAGVLRPGEFFGRKLGLDRDLALRAFGPLAAQLGRSVEEAAWDVIRIASAKMSEALRLVSVERGHDPRDLTLIAYGGAGPLHAAENAGHLGIRRVMVPPSPGAFSAYGLLCANFQRDHVRTLIRPLVPASADDVQGVFDDLAATAVADYAEMGVLEVPDLERFLDVRYVGQAYEVRVPAGPAAGPIDLDAVRLRFEEAHQARYGFAEPESPAEIVHQRIVGTVARETPRFVPHGEPTASESWTTGSVFAGEQTACRFVPRAALDVGIRHPGPLVVEELTATTYVPDGWTVTLDGRGCLWLEPTGEVVP